MGLRTKIVIVISLTLVSLISTLYLASRTILLNSFIELEEQRTHQNVERVLSILSDQLANLETTTQDYAEWDDTYSFVMDGNQDYINANLTDLTFTDLKLNLILIINTSGRLVFAKNFDLERGQETPVSAGLSKYISTNSPLVNHEEIGTGLKGLILLPEGPMLVASRPILTNESQGPIHGALIFGRYLDSAAIEQLAEIAHLSLTTRLFNDLALPPDFETAKSSLSKQSPILIRSLNTKTIAGYALVEDIYGEPILILRIDSPRLIYQQGQSSLSYLLASLLITGLVFSLIVLWLLERLVLTRLLQLSANVSSIGAGGDFSTRAPVRDTDELASLTQAINQMLEALQQSQDTLQKAHDDLERRVEERTTALSEANTQLKLEIVERERIEAELIEARDQALEVSRLKTALLAKVSHELRTPLAVILGFAEMLEFGVYGLLSDQQRQAIAQIIDGSHYLTKMVNELLVQAQLEASRSALNISSFAPADLVKDTVAQMSFLADNKKLTLKADVASNVPAAISSDLIRIKHILVNLVDNAIKFTQTGTIHIHVYQPDPAHWALQVSDTGPGIPPEAQSYIFEPFRQVDDSPTRQHGGTGLGLSIVKQLTTLLGGQITLESEIGQGSVFTVTFPLEFVLEK